jgi:hypothetical protein
MSQKGSDQPQVHFRPKVCGVLHVKLKIHFSQPKIFLSTFLLYLMQEICAKIKTFLSSYGSDKKE